MKTILVPTDFSSTARNAAKYALALANQIAADRIVLYNAYQAPVSVDPMVPTVQLLDMDLMKKSSEEGLAEFKAELAKEPFGNIEMDTFSEYNVLTGGINELCKAVGADFIVMGITGGGAVTETLIGSNAVSVSQHSIIPVVIVPPDANFVPIKNVVLACDFKQVLETTPIKLLTQLLENTGAKLHVLHVNSSSEKAIDVSFENMVLDGLLKGLHPEYHFVENESFTVGINQFADDNKMDLIITMPKKHGFFDSIFKKSHTKRLAFHSHLPLMVMHD
ncbi:MAG: universal stress protein [Chitinophagaceae bacterium]|nr:universal stress protein [Chitinophagaceae bacterium]